MIEFQTVLLRVAAASLAMLAFSGAPALGQQKLPTLADEAAMAAFQPMLGGAAPAGLAHRLGALLRVPSADPAAHEQPFFAVLEDTGSPGSPKYEAGGLTLEFHPDTYDRLRVENARVVLSPSADGRTCRFELEGSPFGATSKFTASGTVEWKAGPAGGDKLDLVWKLDAPVDAVRAWIPERIDPSFSGTLSLGGNGSGVIRESTTEEAPATPLRGDFQLSLDLTALGRTGPFTSSGQFSLDDRMVRVTRGTLAWQGHSYPLKGWFRAPRDGDFQLGASFENVDTLKVATDWNVPEAWRPTALLSGNLSLSGKPGKGQLRYVAKAPSIDAPGFEGNTIHLENARLQGGLLEINAEVAASIRADKFVVRGIDLGDMPVGIRWWKGDVLVTSSNTPLWGGEHDFTIKYTPALHPDTKFNGRVRNGKAPEMLRALAPTLGVDAEGSGSIAFAIDRQQSWDTMKAFHASLTTGRIGGIDLFASTLAALAEAEPSLALADAATVAPKPRRGTGTRVDRLYFEAAQKGDAWELGGLYLQAAPLPNTPAFQLDADGQFTNGDGLELDGTVTIPAPAAARLEASAAWVKALRKGEALVVPVTVRGPLSSLRLEIEPEFREAIARAKRGEPVEAVSPRTVRHVGPEGLAPIPADPAFLEPR